MLSCNVCVRVCVCERERERFLFWLVRCKEENYDNQRFWCFNSVIRSPIAKSFLIRKTYARVCACAVVFWPVCICVLNRSKRHVRDVLPRPASQTTDNLWPWSTSDATNFKDFKYNQLTDWLRSLQINFERTVSSNYHTPLSPTQVPLVSPVTPPSFCVGPVPSCGEEQYRLLVVKRVEGNNYVYQMFKSRSVFIGPLSADTIWNVSEWPDDRPSATPRVKKIKIFI